MPIFIKTFVTEKDSALVNVDTIVSISSPSTTGLAYTSVLGHQAGGYAPKIAACKKEYAEIVYTQLQDFLATNDKGIFDAHKIVSDLYAEELKKMQKK